MTDSETKLNEHITNAHFISRWPRMLEMASSMVKKIEGIAIAVIDFPTARVDVACTAMNQVWAIWQRVNSCRACRFRVLVFCNARFDLVAFVQDKALEIWPLWRAVVVQRGRSKFRSSRRRRPPC